MRPEARRPFPADAGNTIRKIGVTGNRLVDKDVILLAVKAKAGDTFDLDKYMRRFIR